MGTDVPYLTKKKHGYYWSPGPHARALGFKSQALGKDRTIAISKAAELNSDLARERDRAGSLLAKNSVNALIRLYEQDPEYKTLREKTQKSYDWCLKEIRELCGDQAVDALTPRVLRRWYTDMFEQTPSKANAVFRVLQILMRHAILHSMITSNPFEGFRRQTTPPRDVIWPMEAVERFCATAIKMGRPSLALAVRLGLDLGQREGDILSLAWNQWDGAKLSLKQSKTGAVVTVAATPELKAMLKKAKRTGVQMVISETTKQPYKEDFFRHEFARVSAAAGTTKYWFMDLRRTAVLYLGRAGATVSEIAAITGHSIKTVYAILRTYMPRDSEMADAGIRKLNRYRKSSQKSEAVVGASRK